jgi:hypothetical protein
MLAPIWSDYANWDGTTLDAGAENLCNEEKLCNGKEAV